MSHARTKGKGPTGQEPLACTGRETEAWREKVLLHLNVASFCQTTPRAQEWRKQRRGQEGASDQEHTYWQGTLSGRTRRIPTEGWAPQPRIRGGLTAQGGSGDWSAKSSQQQKLGPYRFCTRPQTLPGSVRAGGDCGAPRPQHPAGSLGNMALSSLGPRAQLPREKTGLEPLSHA